MGVSLLMFVVGIALIPTTIPIKLAAVGALGVLTAALYRFANQRVVLPDSFPLPIPEPEPEEVVVQEAAQAAAPVQTEEAPKVKGTPVTVEIPDVIPPLERKEGEPIKMYVIMEGMQYELEVNEGENSWTRPSIATWSSTTAAATAAATAAWSASSRGSTTSRPRRPRSWPCWATRSTRVSASRARWSSTAPSRFCKSSGGFFATGTAPRPMIDPSS